MTAALGMLVAALLAAAFAAAGELVLRRRSRDLVAWNESFLVGAGVAAAALFPLSLLLRHHAFRVELVLLGACFVARIARAGSRGARAKPASPPPLDGVSRALVAGIVVVASCFVALDLRYNLFWDGLLIWGSKAQVLFHEGFLGRSWYPDDAYELRHLTYPPLIPLVEAAFAAVERRFDFDALKPVFIPFYLSLPISIYAAARALASRRLALAAALMLAILPPLATRHAAGGYADMPEAAFVAGAAASAFRRMDDGRTALPWLVGGLTTVKAEGTILAMLASAAILGVWWLERGAEPPRGRRWRGAAIVAVFLALRLAYVRWLAVPDPVYVPIDAAHLREAIARLPTVFRLCLVKTLSPRRWGLLWPGFALAGLILVARGTPRERALVAFTAAAAVALALPFLLTTWPLELQIDQAYPRLLEQLAPTAVVGLVLALCRAVDPTSARALEPSREPGMP
jgi:hypothetical protein